MSQNSRIGDDQSRSGCFGGGLQVGRLLVCKANDRNVTGGGILPQPGNHCAGVVAGGEQVDQYYHGLSLFGTGAEIVGRRYNVNSVVQVLQSVN